MTNKNQILNKVENKQNNFLNFLFFLLKYKIKSY